MNSDQDKAVIKARTEKAIKKMAALYSQRNQAREMRMNLDEQLKGIEKQIEAINKAEEAASV